MSPTHRLAFALACHTYCEHCKGCARKHVMRYGLGAVVLTVDDSLGLFHCHCTMHCSTKFQHYLYDMHLSRALKLACCQ